MDSTTGMLSAVNTDVPLIVDLDGTLILTDTLHESFVQLFFRNPFSAIAVLASISKGRASFKRHVTAMYVLNAATLPQRGDLIALLRSEKSRGRPVHLVTAADQQIADDIAAAVGLFDSATGSDGSNNLKGPNKLAWLKAKMPGGFLYAGDSRADLPVFLGARGAIFCDVPAPVQRAVEHAGIPVLARLKRRRDPVRGLFDALRPHHWAKNVLIFLPLMLSHAFGDVSNILKSVAAFVLLCLLASGTYLINDLADLEADRQHPAKSKRPLAAGDLPLSSGLIAAVAMILGALAGAAALSLPFALTLAAYLALTAGYSFGLKRIKLLDAHIVAGLLTLRLAMGAAVLSLPQSPWLLGFSLAFFCSMVFAKRYAELNSIAPASPGARIAGRSYSSADGPLLLAFGLGSAFVSVIVLLLFVTAIAAGTGRYAQPQWLYALPALITAWHARVWFVSRRMKRNDDPVVIALRDPIALMLAALVMLFTALAL